jgi:succinyl-CoA synthetase alpha subunit
MVEGPRGSSKAVARLLEECGVHVVKSTAEIGKLMSEVL